MQKRGRKSKTTQKWHPQEPDMSISLSMLKNPGSYFVKRSTCADWAKQTLRSDFWRPGTSAVSRYWFSFSSRSISRGSWGAFSVFCPKPLLPVLLLAHLRAMSAKAAPAMAASGPIMKGPVHWIWKFSFELSLRGNCRFKGFCRSSRLIWCGIEIGQFQTLLGNSLLRETPGNSELCSYLDIIRP